MSHSSRHESRDDKRSRQRCTIHHPAKQKADKHICHQIRNQYLLTFSGRVSGIPWQITSFTDVQHDFGKL